MHPRDEEPALEQQIQDVEARLEIYAGLLAALSEPHDLLQILLASTEPDTAVPALRARFDISEIAALAVLDLQFRRTTTRDRARIREQHDEMAQLLEQLRRRVAGSEE